MARSLDPYDPTRRLTLESQRKLRVESHVAHEIVDHSGMDIPVSYDEATQCPCLLGA